MIHPESWYWELAVRLGHRGFVTLQEITDAERTEREEAEQEEAYYADRDDTGREEREEGTP